MDNQVPQDDQHGKEEADLGTKMDSIQHYHATTNEPELVMAHPLLIVADDLVSVIEDYPTLICLSMTCRFFYNLIHRSESTLYAAFERLEKKIPMEPRPQPLEFHSKSGAIVNARSESLARAMKSWNREQNSLRPDGIDVMSDYDLLRYSTGQLYTEKWLPCYYCRSILPRDTRFFADGYYKRQSRNGMVLELCGFNYGAGSEYARRRKCVNCCVQDELWFWQHPRRYLQDMPRGFPGFRLKCSKCDTAEWITTRPLKRQERKKLCDRCFRNFLIEEVEGSSDNFEDWWRALDKISIGLERPRTQKKGLLVIRDTEEGLKVGPSAGADIDNSETWYRFEVLDTCDT